MFWSILVTLGLFALTYVYFFREAFFAELVISFLPYLFVGLVMLFFVVLVVLVCRIWKIWKSKKREKFRFLECRTSLGML